MTLTEFLLARIAEDERDLTYEFSAGHGYRVGGRSVDMRERVQAECEAKQRIAARHFACEFFRPGGSDLLCQCGGCWPCDDLRDAAAVYADHPDYREEWRP